MIEQIPTVVLVPGAWADGSCWRKVIRTLYQSNIKTVTVPLPLTSLADDIAALDRTLERVDGPAVLAGHAYAGAVIGATQNETVRALVYIAALAPAQGQTVADVFYMNEPHADAPKLAPDGHGWIWLPSDAFPTAFAQNATREEQAELEAVQRPISPACISVPVGRPRWRDVPSWYLLAEQDHMIVPKTQQFMANRMNARVSSHPVDHIPSITAPNTVVELLTSVVHTVKGETL